MNKKLNKVASLLLLAAGIPFNVFADHSVDHSTIQALSVQIAQLQALVAALNNQLNYQAEETIVGNLSKGFQADLRPGMKNNSEVRRIQEFLLQQGVYNEIITGNYGPITTQAVKKFQVAHGIQGTGYFGAATRTRANEILADSSVKPSIKLLVPNGGETWIKGQQYQITWTQRNISAQPVKISFYKKDNKVYQEDKKVYEFEVVNAYLGTSFIIPQSFEEGSYDVLVSVGCDIAGSSCSAFDRSDAPFQILTTDANLGIEVTVPYLASVLNSIGASIKQIQERVKTLSQ